ncbi:hypothetical protein [Paenibacillus sp. YIM B09110]|uniref:hypothetical protein n=1 Tax=Paenibacillus sp. YIM B09110 TaxID=3126102 RepID=UPI00301BACD7
MTTQTYKETFEDAVTDLIAEGIADRGARMKAIEALTEAYVDDVGERPGSAQLERLTDYLLREELTDVDPYKIAHAEYPFMSEWQLDLRRDRETGLKAVEETGADGRDYRKPTKRRRTNYENWRIDRDTRSLNANRAAQYKRDTAAGALVTYNVHENGGEVTESFAAAQSVAETWRERLSTVY